MALFDEIAHSRPIDRTARNVVSRGAHYQPPAQDKVNVFAECPPLVSFARDKAKYPQFRDLTGRKVGHVVCVGYAGHGRWFCRCVCGRYLKVKTKGILRPTGEDPQMCQICNNAEHVRRGYKSLFGRTGA